MNVRFSFIVPFHRGLANLSQCVNALVPLPPDSELIIAADGALDDCAEIAVEHQVRVVNSDPQKGPRGPAVARNVAAAAATGDVLVFVDSDVVVSRSGLEQLVRIFENQPGTAAVFGSYDDRPGDPGFVSQYKNLSHAFVHRASARSTRTFWAGFGAIRRDVFRSAGGFDERFERPCVEDIDLGYRVTEAGHEVVIDPGLGACHLKRWTVRSCVVSDIRDRGIPWMQLMLRYGIRRDHLNVSARHRWSVVLAYAALASLCLTMYDPRFAIATTLALIGIPLLNRGYYSFFCRTRGVGFAVRVWPMHVLHHLCNGVSAAAGIALFVAARH